MKAEETRKKIIKELNQQLDEVGSFLSGSKGPEEPITTFPSPIFEKPKMFAPHNRNHDEMTEIVMGTIPPVRGIRF